VNTEPGEGQSVLVLAGDADEAADAAGALSGFDASSAAVGDGAPPRPGDGDLAADVAVVLDAAGLDAVRERDRFCRVVALVDDPAAPPATDPLVDAIATTPADLDATLRWLVARTDPGLDRDDPTRTPLRIEQLNAEVTRLASVRSIEEAHRTAIAVADEVFPRHHCVVGVRDGEWVEPVATSSEVSIEDCNRVRVGRGSVGTAVDTGEPVIESRSIGESPYDTLLSLPVGDDTALQLATDEDDGFDANDRRLAELLASHVEETLDRIRADGALRTERDHLLALFSNVPDPAIAYDYVEGEPIVHRVNEAFEETFGYDAERVVGESVDGFIVPPTDEAESEATELNERLQCGENVRREVTRETADGPRHFILHVVPIRLDAENVSGYAIYTDVTDRREREAALERQNERLDEFASIVSHDLRNPLSVAEGYVDLATETGETAYLEKAAEALDRMDELVGDLLSLARQGESVGETTPVSIGALARDAWESVDTGDAELVVDGDVTIDAHPVRTRELLENVFRNSVEHGSTGSRAEPGDSVEHGRSSLCENGGAGGVDPLTVRIGEGAFRGDDEESRSGFFVEDDGRGLPEGERDRVFESGFTTDENGTGLGLAITKRIADAHGWEVRALAGEEGGARFEFKTS